MATRKPKKGAKVAASRVRDRQARAKQRTETLAAKLEREKARARLSRTERQVPWKRSLARAEEKLRLARRTDDSARADQLNREAAELIEQSKRERNKPTANMLERAATINAWRRDLTKALPSRSLIAWCEVNGRWCPNADGTITGESHFEVPRSAQRDFRAFKDWFLELKRRFSWLKDEPVYFSIGFTVGGSMLLSSSERSRYDRIRGQSATISYWKPSETLPYQEPKRKPKKKPTKKRATSWTSNTGKNPGWETLAANWIADPKADGTGGGTAYIIFNKPGESLSIKTVSIFVHYGPTPPLAAGEFDCESPSLGSRMGPTPSQVAPEKPTKPEKPAKPTKPKAPKKPKVVSMFVVYDENSRRYAQKKAYSGNVPNLWGPLKTAYFFETRKQAQSAASNLNASRPARSRYRAVVWPVDVTLT